MKSIGKGYASKRIKEEADKYCAEIGYNAIVSHAPCIMQQTEATMLYALYLHGYTKEQLKQFHDWYCQIMTLPEIMGKTPKLTDVMQVVHDKCGIDFDRVCPKFPTFKEWYNGKR